VFIITSRSFHVLSTFTKQTDLKGVNHRKKALTTPGSLKARPAPDLIDRDFTTHRPNQLFVVDITYMLTWAGLLHLECWPHREAMAN